MNVFFKLRRIIVLGLGFLFAPWLAMGQHWSSTTAPINYWYGIASSADGTKLLAAPDGDHLYYSTDSGANWAPYYSSPDGAWIAAASSADGNVLYGIEDTANGSFIYVSKDSGTTWNVTAAANTNEPVSLACSADGKHIVTGGYFGVIFTSSDYGSNWVQAVEPGQQIWEACACSADGRVMASVSFAQPIGLIAVTTNYGATWSTNNNAPQNRYWDGIACSADGTKMAVVCENGPYTYNDPSAPTIFTSTDSGTTWSGNNDAPTNGWRTVASSADGTRLVAAGGNAIDNDLVYISTNSGTNWTVTDAIAEDWRSVACSADGGKLYGAIGEHDHTGPIQRSSIVVLAPTLNIAPAGTNAMISWTVPSTNFVLQQSLSLSSPSWSAVTNVPVLTNYQNAVTVAATNKGAFFQLKTN